MRSSRLLGVLLAGACWSYSGCGHAQVAQAADAEGSARPSAPSRQAASSPAPETGEIIVTAQRRSESAQRTPIALSVVTSEALEKQNVFEVNDLQRVTPALTVQEVGLTKFINIRGVGLNASLPGLSTGIAYHIDGLFSREFGLQTPYFDLQRVEVLRGPQGTLAGQNATGGAIFVVSEIPKIGVTTGYGEASYGNYDHYSVEGALNVPLTDTLAFRMAGYGESRDSYTTNLVSPTSSEKASFQPGNLNRIAARGSLLFKPSDRLEVILRAEFFDLRTDGLARKVFDDPIADPYTISVDSHTKADTVSRRFSAEAKLKLTDGIQLRSLTGYQINKINIVYDDDGTNVATPDTVQRVTQPAFSQEFNLISTGGGPADWVVGAYYYDFTGNSAAHVMNAAIDANAKPTSRSEALFGQLTYKVIDNLKLIGGIRYNRDRNAEAGAIQILVAPGQPTISYDSVAKTNAWTGKIGADYQLSNDQNIYATASKGYRAGGTNIGGGPTFGKETIYNYEVGLKSVWLDRHLRTQIDAYYDVYHDVQVDVINPVTKLDGVVNAGDAKFWGVEAQAQANLGNLLIEGNLAYNHSRLGQASLIDPLGAATPVNVDGRRLPLAPAWTGSISAEYRVKLANGDTITPRIQYSYIGQQWASVFYRSFENLHPFRQWQARLTYNHGKFSIAGYTTNFTDQTYVSGLSQSRFRFYAPPREYGVRVGYRF